ncbi:MAG: hypothetical protein Q9213_006748 [Squamulea squamosa]
MPACIERHDTRSQEQPRKRQRVSVDAEVVGSSAKRRRLFKDVDISQRSQPISKKEFISDWFSNAGWSRQKTPNKMSHLPSPDVTTRSFSRAATASSQRSTASVSDPDYRERLEQYNIYTMGERPPPEFLHEVEKMVFRQRESPELDDAAIEQLRGTMRDLQNKGEEEVRIKLGAYIIPGYSTSTDKRLEVVHGQLWNKAVPVPPDRNALELPLPLPTPKPDTTIAYSKSAFNRSQLATMNLLVRNHNGPSLASPCQDQNSAYINVEWIGTTSDTGQHTFHHEELRMLPLEYGDSIQVLQRALKNIYDYAVDDLLKLILDALDEYRNKIKTNNNADSMEKPHTEAEPRAPPSPPQPPRRKRARAAAAAMGQTATQSKQNAQSQAKDQRPGVRTRRTAHLVDPK